MPNYTLNISLLVQYKTQDELYKDIYLIDINNQRYIMYLKDYEEYDLNDLNHLIPVEYPINKEQINTEILNDKNDGSFTVKYNNTVYVIIKDNRDNMPIYELKEQVLNFTGLINTIVGKLKFERNIPNYNYYLSYQQPQIMQHCYTYNNQLFAYITPQMIHHPQPVYQQKLMSNMLV